MIDIEKLVNYINDRLDKYDARNQPVNSADLKVCEIADKTVIYPEKEDTILMITIDEAAPEAYELQEYIIDCIDSEYPELVYELITEW